MANEQERQEVDSAGTKKSVTALREDAVLAFWHDKRIFEKSLEKDAPRGTYVFYDGPPFATGTPHYGHIVASVIKDAVPRFFTMRGYRIPRVWGWDCHGLPIENIVEKELGFKHKKDIKAFGVAKFNEQCRAQVLQYVDYWKTFIPRIGRWVDMEHAYHTMDKSFMESVWWVFKQIYDKGLVYESYRSMHICPRCETTLSQQEVAEGYKEVKDIAVTVKFRVKNPEKIGYTAGTGEVYLLAWTTTPWTLPGNVALAVGEDIDYVVVPDGDDYVIRAKREHDREAPIRGFSLVGLEYEPIFDYYANDETLKNRENGWKVYAADFVTTDTGTGIVHIAPSFGEDDMTLGYEKHLPFVQHVAYDGTMKPEVRDFAGMAVKPKSSDDRTRLDTDIKILTWLSDHNALFDKENITHAYPHCWRCDTPLLNYATSSWFVSVTKIKEHLIENASRINWSPAHIKEGRFGKWLDGARDWSISRQRFWASVIPVWRCEVCGSERVFGSVAELEEASGATINDLHKHIIDEVTVPCSACTQGGDSAKEGNTIIMRRVPDVLDTWFDSGSMPYGERHYPFENKDEFDNSFPARFIAEGVDQTRAWFYYLHVLAGALFDKPAFQNVIVNGIVVSPDDGRKLSKSKKNYPDPMLIIDRYGADALRFYLLSSPVVQAENLAFVESGVDEIAKKNIGRLANVLAFYQLHADGTEADTRSRDPLDRWIMARLAELTLETIEGYEAYTLDRAVRPATLFIDDLSVWYVRRSRERFKDGIADRGVALATLRFVLRELAKVIAPAMPFIAEEVYQAVRGENDPESVHLCAWPETVEVAGDGVLKNQMARVRVLASEAHQLRQDAGIGVRQPLASLTIPDEFAPEFATILADEVNVKEIKKGGEVALDTTPTAELIREGNEREKASAIARARKAEGFSPQDEVEVVEGEGPYRYVLMAETGGFTSSGSAVYFTLVLRSNEA